MRIVHCLRAPVGGLFRHVLDLAGAQAALGHDVGMIVDSTATDALTEQRIAAIAPQLSLGVHRVAIHRMPAPSDLSAYRDITAHVRGLSLDVLHGHGAKGGAFARLAARALKARGQQIKSFYTPHGGSLNYSPASLEGRFFLHLEGVLDRLTQGLIFESRFAAGVYRERVALGTAPQRVIHNGLQPRDFARNVPTAGATDFMYIGELRPVKGVDVLLRALAALNKGRAQPLTATIVGSGPDGNALMQLAADLGLSDTVRFPGAMPAAQAFSLGRTLVVPSRKESFPYVVLEAAAAAMPLITTNVGGIPEIVEGSDTLPIPANDVPALVAAMADVVNNPATAQARADRLNTVVASRFTVDHMTAQVLNFYAEAMAAPRCVKSGGRSLAQRVGA